METAAYRIKQLRQSLELNQEEFAARVNISQPLLSLVENEKLAPSLELVMAIVAVFGHLGVTYESLLHGQQTRQTGRVARVQMAFGRNLQIAMDKEGLDITTLAAHTRLGELRLQNLIAQQSVPTYDELITLLLHLGGYNANWLLLDKGPMKLDEREQQIAEFLRLKQELFENMDKVMRKKAKLPHKK